LNILLLDSSSKNIEFALCENNKIYINKKLDSEINADSLIYELKTVIDKYNKSISDLDVVSLSNGPGSFTGLRIGSAISKGICLANDCKLVEIPTLDIIVNRYKNDAEAVALIYSNSRTEEFYFAEYKIEKCNFSRTSDYSVKRLEEIDLSNKTVLINERIDSPALEKFNVIDIFTISNIQSQSELTLDYIKRDEYSDFGMSEPFYMKKFIPLVKR
jgi:tRNA threonylcarbamoyladenosine biosynthesis protein TsaB